MRVSDAWSCEAPSTQPGLRIEPSFRPDMRTLLTLFTVFTVLTEAAISPPTDLKEEHHSKTLDVFTRFI